MKEQTSIELLEATHAFPCMYVFKAIGRDEEDFVMRVVTAIRDETGNDKDPAYTLRSSAGGAHVAITLEVLVQSPEQVLAIYEQVRTIPGLKMLW